MYLNKIFIALQKEALFTNELLGYGATQLLKADFFQKGIYFQAFNNLSIGFERIGKLCLMLDHYIDHNGVFPTPIDLKTKLGHDLYIIYVKSKDIIEKRNLTFSFLSNLDSDLYLNILSILSCFAKGDRYSNLNYLTDSSYRNDPIRDWYIKVDQNIYRNMISDKKKQSIKNNVQCYPELLEDSAFVLFTSEDGAEINSIKETYSRKMVNNAVAPVRQLLILQMIRFWVELLDNLTRQAIRVNLENIPEFNEIFGRFINEDSLLKRKKSWVGFY